MVQNLNDSNNAKMKDNSNLIEKSDIKLTTGEICYSDSLVDLSKTNDRMIDLSKYNPGLLEYTNNEFIDYNNLKQANNYIEYAINCLKSYKSSIVNQEEYNESYIKLLEVQIFINNIIINNK